MSKSLSTAEFASCLAKDPWAHTKHLDTEKHTGADITSHLDKKDVLHSHMQGPAKIDPPKVQKVVPVTHHENYAYYLQ